jgi:hypothetical protein
VALPAEVTAITGRFLELIDAGAPGLVTGLYLRGSLAFGEYFPGQSDVDFTAGLAGSPMCGLIRTRCSPTATTI